MSLLFMDGFDYMSDNQRDDLKGKWEPGNTDSQHDALTGRGGSGSAVILQTNTNAQISHQFPASFEKTMIFGFAFRYTVVPTGRLVILLTSNSREITPTQMTLGMHIGGQLYCQRGATDALATSTKSLNLNTWYHIEVITRIENSSGAGGKFEVKVDGTNLGWINFAGDTQNVGGNWIDTIRFVGTILIPTIDDFYMLDSDGSRLNASIGDCQIETLHPDGVGNDVGWTPSAGTNWEATDEVIPDRDTTYVHATAAATEDRHTHGNLASTTDNVHAVAVNLFAAKQEAGNRDIRTLAHDGTTEGIGATELVPGVGQYLWHQEIYEDHPSGAAVWTSAEVDSGEFGYRINA